MPEICKIVKTSLIASNLIKIHVMISLNVPVELRKEDGPSLCIAGDLSPRVCMMIFSYVEEISSSGQLSLTNNMYIIF